MNIYDMLFNRVLNLLTIAEMYEEEDLIEEVKILQNCINLQYKKGRITEEQKNSLLFEIR